MKAFIKRNGILFVAPVLLAVLLLSIFAVKGIYPFGGKNISYYDMSQSFVPLYYNTYDILHGDKGLFFDWFSGMGKNTVSLFGMFVLSPLNLFFYFVERDMILESMSLFLILKMCLAAFTMGFYLHKSYKALDKFWMVLFAMMYSCSGYVLQYYTNIHFLEIVILFPLLMYFMERMYQDNRRLGYILCYAACVILNLYFAFMVSLFILLSSYLYIRFRVLREKRKYCYVNLIYGTGMGLLLSAILFVPNVWQMMQTGRLGGEQSGGYLEIASQFYTIFWGQRLFMLYGCELALAIILLFIILIKEINNYFWYYIGCIAFLLVPVFVESVNALWHMGSYTQFPYRFGYMLSFACCNGAAFYLSQGRELVVNKHKVLLVIGKILTVLLSLSSIVIIILMMKGFAVYGILNLDNYIRYILVFFLLLATFSGILVFFKKVRKAFIFIMVLLQIASGVYWMVGEKEAALVEHNNSIVSDAKELKESFAWENDYVSRVKAPEVNVNYGLLIQHPTLANWTDQSNTRIQDELICLGYTNNNNRLVESGGTVFSDALLNINKTASKIERDDQIYKEVGESEHFHLYENIFVLPFGIQVGKELLEDKTFTDEDAFSYTNALYKDISGDEENLIHEENLGGYIADQEYDGETGLYTYTIEIPVAEKSILYLDNKDKQNEEGAYQFYYIFRDEDENIISIPDLSDIQNAIYPASFNNGYLEMGVYEKEKVTFHIETNAYNLDMMFLGQMDYAKMQELCNRYAGKGVQNLQIAGTRMSFDADTGQERFVFLPVEYSKGWKAVSEKQDVKIYPVMHGTFMAIEVEPGKTQIDMKFTPQGLQQGVYISIAGILLLLLCTFCKWDEKLVQLGVLQRAGKGLMYAVVAMVVLFFYICPVILAFVSYISVYM